MSSSEDYVDPVQDDNVNDDDDSTQRLVWEILSWIAVALTIILNLALVVILIVRKNIHTFVNKGEGEKSADGQQIIRFYVLAGMLSCVKYDVTR